MIHLLESFGCGICFAFGAMVGISITALISNKDREKVAKEIRNSNLRVEERVGVYVAAMSEILAETKKGNGKDA
jgi:uncharacterized membrane protein